MLRIVMPLLAVLVCLGASGCSDDKSPTGTVPGSIVNNLVFERPGDWEDGAVAVPALHITVGASAPGSGLASYWSLRVVLADVTVSVPMSFPNSFIWDQPKDADLFVLDSPNELSTADVESSGSITFSQLQTGAEGYVEFTIDAVVGSELKGGSSLNVRGTFKGPVSEQSPGKAG